MTTLTLSAASPVRLRADALVVGVVQGPRGLRLAEGAGPVDEAFGGTLRRTLKALGATGKADQVTLLPSEGVLAAPVLLAVGLGADARSPEALRRAAGAAVRALAGRGHVAVALPAADADSAVRVAEGALYGAYAFTAYRSTSSGDHPQPPRRVTVVTPAARSTVATRGTARAQVLARSMHLVRDLVNTPGADLTPADFAARAERECRSLRLTVDVLDERALRRGGYGGLLGVGGGSAHPPRLVRIAYRPARATRHLALVGKGITFDSGGLSLKTASGMEWMKCDMGGAAAVLGALLAVARLKLPVAVTGWLALAENMPSGSAQRPGDVITIHGGTTVEVVNTDAEGRLVLADALVRAGEEGPDVLVDAATLTGSQMVALGTRVGGLMSNDDSLRSRLHELSDEAGEPMWPMPLPEELKASLESPIADLKNLGDSYGGMLSAGLFLQAFVPVGTPWAHLDIAGPAYNEGDAHGYTPRGGTGAAVRTFVALAESVAAGKA